MMSTAAEWERLRYKAQSYLRLPALREPGRGHQRSNPHHDPSTGQFSSGGGSGVLAVSSMSPDEYERSYDVHDEVATSSGITAVLMTNGDMQIRFDDPDRPDVMDVLLDVSADEGREIGEAFTSMADAADDLPG